MRGILKNIQKTPERMYSKNLVTDRFTVREIINGLTWWAKANYYFASVTSFYHPSTTSPWEKTAKHVDYLRCVRPTVWPCYRSHNNEHCTLRRSQEDWVILKKMPIYNIAIVKNRRWMKNKWIIKEYLAKGISSLCLGMCYLLSKHKWKSQSWPKLIKRNCT